MVYEFGLIGLVTGYAFGLLALYIVFPEDFQTPPNLFDYHWKGGYLPPTLRGLLFCLPPAFWFAYLGREIARWLAE